LGEKNTWRNLMKSIILASRFWGFDKINFTTWKLTTAVHQIGSIVRIVSKDTQHKTGSPKSLHVVIRFVCHVQMGEFQIAQYVVK